jgi:NADH-quinone oxidoreductase subunit N
VRRLLAYSAVAHAGYTLLGLVAGGRDGFSATLFYTAVYAITLVGAFGVVAVVRHQTGGDDLQNFSGLRARSPLLAGCMAIFMLSLAGIPPLAGFFGKFYLFSAALRAGGNHGLLWLVALALFGSFISLYYYLIVLRAIFVDEVGAQVPQKPEIDVRPAAAWNVDLLQRITVAVLALAILFFGVMPETLAARIMASLP